ncbi:MAG: amino acid permease [Pseudomonadota bacterium]
MNAALNRSLSFYQLLFYGIIAAIGTIIYSAIEKATGFTELASWINFFFLVTTAILTLFSYRKLIALLPSKYTDNVSLKKTLAKQHLPSFLAGYQIILNIITCCVTVALAYAGYINIFFTIPPLFIASFLLLTYTTLHISGFRQSIALNIFLVITEITGLFFLITWGLQQDNTSLFHAETLADFNIGTIGSFLAATSLSFFMYISFEDITNSAEADQERKRNLKQALFWSLCITLVIYLLVLWISMGVMLSNQVAPSMSPLNTLTQTMHPMISKTLSIILFYFTASTALIIFTHTNSLLFIANKNLKILNIKLLPSKIIGLSILAFFTVASCLLSPNNIKTFISIFTLFILLIFITIQLANITLLYKKNNAINLFSLPLIGIISCIVLMVYIHYELKVYIITTILLVIYFLYYKNKNSYR